MWSRVLHQWPLARPASKDKKTTSSRRDSQTQASISNQFLHLFVCVCVCVSLSLSLSHTHIVHRVCLDFRVRSHLHGETGARPLSYCPDTWSWSP